jgi:hypothetical protein
MAEDKGAKAAVGAGALGLLMSEVGAVSGPLVEPTVLAGGVGIGAFIALLNTDRSEE